MADNITFDFSQLLQLGNELEATMNRFKDDAWAVLMDKSDELRTNVKRDMPVDTGAARDSWGSVPAGAVSAAKGLGGIWNEDKAGLTIEQGAVRDSYNYIIRLNEGYSSQAPVGFIDDNYMKIQDALDEAVQNLLQNIL